MSMLEEAEDKMKIYLEMSGEAEDGMSATDAEALNRETEGHRKTHYTKQSRARIARESRSWVLGGKLNLKR